MRPRHPWLKRASSFQHAEPTISALTPAQAAVQLRAAEAVVAPVPPFAMATTPVTLPAVVAVEALPARAAVALPPIRPTRELPPIRATSRSAGRGGGLRRRRFSISRSAGTTS